MSDTRHKITRARRTTIAAAGAAAALCLLAVGCTGKKKPTVSSTAKPSPSPTPAGPALSATVIGPKITWTDGKGAIIAQIKAEAATVTPSESAGAKGQAYQGGTRNGTATLYQKGKPTATLRADIIDADQTTHMVKGRGNVVVKSLTSPDSPTIRADSMTWRYDADEITGSGNVVATRPPDWRLPAQRFTADTRVRKYTLYSSGSPATGSY